jgi:DNA-binding MarR family transcriptional regulator
MDKVEHGTSFRGASHPNAKLTQVDIDAIRSRYAAGGILQRELADEFGVRQGQVSRILSRTRW